MAEEAGLIQIGRIEIGQCNQPRVVVERHNPVPET
jgi:hypothetical protein